MKRVFTLSGWCVAIVTMWASSPALAADDFAQRFALQLDEGAAYYSVALPAAVYAASQRDDLGDVRVFNSAGEPVPYALDAPREPPRTPPRLHPVDWFPLQPAASRSGAPVGIAIATDGSLRATAPPPSRSQHDTELIDVGRAPSKEASPGGAQTSRVSALLVHLLDDNYQGRVIVEASDDLRHWQPAGNAQLLKVSYNGSTLSQDRIELDGARGRYLRLRWLDGVPYLDSIDVEIQGGAADQAQRADRTWREDIVARSGPKPGEYFFNTGGSYPVDRLRLNLPQPDTVAAAVVYSRSGLDAPWREVASATLFRLHNGTVEQTNPALELMSDADRQWRVVVDTANGGVGAGTLTVAAGWRPAKLTFAAQGAAPFILAVGGVEMTSAAEKRADLMAGASAVVATAQVGDVLSAEQVASVQSASKDRDASRRYLLGAALLLAVGSLGAIAWWLARGARGQAIGASGVAPGAAGAMSATAHDAGAHDASAPGDVKR